MRICSSTSHLLSASLFSPRHYIRLRFTLIISSPLPLPLSDLRDHVPPQADHPVRLAEEERNASLPQSASSQRGEEAVAVPVGEEEEMFLREIRDDDAGEVIEEVQVRHDDLACVLMEG
eukprot:55242-Hanusia_phi.AAC.2